MIGLLQVIGSILWIVTDGSKLLTKTVTLSIDLQPDDPVTVTI